MSYNELAAEYRKSGKQTNANVLRGWIGIESHIVGPKDKSTFKYLYDVFGEEVISHDPSEYVNATILIRSTRTKILKLIEKALIMDAGKDESSGIFKDLLEKIKDIVVVKRLDRIEVIDPFPIANYRANKPIDDN